MTNFISNIEKEFKYAKTVAGTFPNFLLWKAQLSIKNVKQMEPYQKSNKVRHFFVGVDKKVA